MGAQYTPDDLMGTGVHEQASHLREVFGPDCPLSSPGDLFLKSPHVVLRAARTEGL